MAHDLQGNGAIITGSDPGAGRDEIITIAAVDADIARAGVAGTAIARLVPCPAFGDATYASGPTFPPDGGPMVSEGQGA